MHQTLVHPLGVTRNRTKVMQLSVASVFTPGPLCPHGFSKVQRYRPGWYSGCRHPCGATKGADAGAIWRFLNVRLTIRSRTRA